MINVTEILRDGQTLKSFPPIQIDSRNTDLYKEYDSKKTRLDRIAEDVYNDSTFWRVILWANPEYFIEFDIPDTTIIRVPYPLQDVVDEIVRKINTGRNREDII